MPKINLSLEEVGCRKPNCKYRLEITSRHHRRCESMFIRAFGKIMPIKVTKRYIKLVDRYDSFDPRDWVRLCAWHHCEIHLIYDNLIHRDKLKRRKLSLVDYTWDEAKALMSKLKKICREWEDRDTPGKDPADCASHRRFPRYRPRRKRRKQK